MAIAKCRAAAALVDGPVLTEDTSLVFNAFSPKHSGGGASSSGSELPGPYIKWFLSDLGLDGLHNLLAGFDDKSAIAVCTFAYTPSPNDEVVLFRGECHGQIVRPRGRTEFGWDAVFQCDDLGGKTFGEATKEEKSRVSHRARALDKVRQYFLAKQQGR